MSTPVSPRSSEGGGGLFSKLRRGRSKLSMKDEDMTASRVSDAERGFDITPSKPNTAKGTPSLSLPLSFANASQTNLREDTGISQYLSTQADSSPTNLGQQVTTDTPETRSRRPVTPQPKASANGPRPGTAASTMQRAESSVDRTYDNGNVSSWQSRVVTEMKEKEQLIGRFEALSRVHMALQEEVEKERARASKAEAAARKKDPAFGKQMERNGTSSVANGIAAGGVGAAGGAMAGSAVTKEHDVKISKDREDLERARAEVDRQREEARQAQADIDRERTIMQTQKAELERQQQSHASMLAEREKEQGQAREGQETLLSNHTQDRELLSQQLSDLNSQHVTTQASLTRANAELSRLKEQNDHLTTSSNAELDHLRQQHQQLTQTSHADLTRLQDHNTQLKTTLAKSSSGAPQTPDSDFTAQMAFLCTDVTTWVTNNFSKTRLDFEKLEKTPDCKELKQIRAAVPQYRKAAEKAKIEFLQALVAARLMDAVWDDEFYVAMPDWEEEHESNEQTQTGRGGLSYLREAYKVLSATNNVDVHAWRALTVSILRRSHDPALTALTNKLISRVAFSINNLLSNITSSSGGGGSALGSSPLPSRVRDLQAFIAKAVDLARQFRGQRAVFEFGLPGVEGLGRTIPFQMEVMEDALDRDGGVEGQRTVVAAVWPYVVRIGGDGVAKGERTVVSKARVVCEMAE